MIAPRYAPDRKARRTLAKILAHAPVDVADSQLGLMELLELYCVLAYQKGLERGRYERQTPGAARLK